MNSRVTSLAFACLASSLVACSGGSTTLAPMPTATPTAGPAVTALVPTTSGVQGKVRAGAPHAAIDLVSQSVATPSGTQVQLALASQTLAASARRSPVMGALRGPARLIAAPGGPYGPGDAMAVPHLRRAGGSVLRATAAERRKTALAIGTQQNFFVTISPLDRPSEQTYRSLGFTLGATTQNVSVWFESTIAAANAGRAAQFGTDLENAVESDTRWLGLPAQFTANAVALTIPAPLCDASGASTGMGQAIIAPYSTIDVLIVDPSALNARIGGQFTPGDLLTQGAANCLHISSNEAATITIGLAPSVTNTDYYLTQFMSHEATHLIEYVNGFVTLGHGGENPGVLQEGLAELSIDFAFGHPDYNNANENAGSFFLPAPQNYAILSMNGLENGTYSRYTYGNYGAAYLLMRYVADRYGPGFARTYILNNPGTADARASFAAFASATGATSFAQLFSDFGTTLAASNAAIPLGSPYAITSFALNGTYVGPSPTAANATFTLPGVAAAAVLPAAASASIFPGGIAVLDASSSLSGATFGATDPTGALQLGGSIVSY